jgi:hypothetical protein
MSHWGSVTVLLSLALSAPLVGVRPQNPAAPSTGNPTSANPQPILIELFTSEGCSSCPLADVLLQRLDDHQPIAGAQLIVLSEHVNYWDHDGWKDPNSSQALTDRQAAYEIQLGEKDSYTPQFVVDGTHEFQLDHIAQMEDVFNKAKDELRIRVRISDVKLDPSDPTTLRAHIETDANQIHNADVYVAVALNHVESQVLKGENGGKHLVHVAVVEELTKIGKLPKGKTFAENVQLKVKPGTDPANLRIVAYVQESGPGMVLGAAMRKPAN